MSASLTASSSSTATYVAHNPGPAWTFNNCVNEPWTGSAYVGNFIVCDTANSESSVTVNGGWYGDAQSGYYIVFQGWSLDLIGTDFTNYTSIIQLSGPTGSVCITGGYFKSGASPYAVLDANSQTVNTVSITGAAFLDHHHPADHNSSGVLLHC